MRIINPGRFIVTINGTDQEIVISLGLKAELFKLITSAQLSLAKLNQKVYLNPELAVRIQELTSKVQQLQKEEASEEEIKLAQDTLDSLYNEAIADLEFRQSTALEAVALEKVDLTEKIFSEAISVLLSKRNEKGVIIEKLDPEIVMWSPIYAEAQEELAELLSAVTDYVTSALKKISAIRKKVDEVTVNKPKE